MYFFIRLYLPNMNMGTAYMIIDDILENYNSKIELRFR
jgi:hypothetical protein